jgi:cellulase
MWGYQKTVTNGTGPVANVASPDIACRFGPLIPPALTAVARAGANMTFQWTSWFENHRGPVLTVVLHSMFRIKPKSVLIFFTQYMGYMPSEDTSVNDVDFFKIDEATYDPKTDAFGSDMLIAANSTRTVTIPSDVKPGIYVVRHEIIGLHFAWQEQPEKKASGAQPYPVCISMW